MKFQSNQTPAKSAFPKASSSKKGFTLVELLVVIAIIAALAGLAVVAIRAGLAAADAGKTTRNMKEIYGALVDISSEGVNTGHHAPNTFPPYKGNLQDAQEASFVWWDLVAERLELADRDTGDYRWSTHYSETVLQNPLSKKELGAGKDTFDSLYNDPDLSYGGFAMNGNISGDVSSDASQENSFVVRESKAANVAGDTIYFAEAADDSNIPGWYFTGTENAPQGNYKDMVHACFIDGHVSTIQNVHMKEASSFKFYTEIEDKNYNNKPD